MQYQFAEPFIVDSTKIATSSRHATPLEQALADTLATYQGKPVQAPPRIPLPRPSRA